MNPPLEKNDAPLAATGFDALQRNGEEHRNCVECQVEIVDNHWFCRLPQNGNGSSAESLTILLCTPRCALRYFAALRPRGLAFEEHERHERSIHFLIDGDKPTWL